MRDFYARYLPLDSRESTHALYMRLARWCLYALCTHQKNIIFLPLQNRDPWILQLMKTIVKDLNCLISCTKCCDNKGCNAFFLFLQCSCVFFQIMMFSYMQVQDRNFRLKIKLLCSLRKLQGMTRRYLHIYLCPSVRPYVCLSAVRYAC